MKTLRTIVILLFAVVIVVPFLACQKESMSTLNDTNSIDSDEESGKYIPGWYWTGYRRFHLCGSPYTYGLQTWWDEPYCDFPLTGNCLEDVYVYAERGNGEDATSKLAHEFLDNYANDSIPFFFSNEKKVCSLFKDIVPLSDITDSIAQGLIVLHDIYAKSDSTHNFIGLPYGIEIDEMSEKAAWFNEIRCVLRIKEK